MNYKFTLILLLSLLVAFGSTPASAQSELRKANRFYDSFEYALALAQYEKVAPKKEPALEMAERMAHAYRLTDNTARAEEWYAKVLQFPKANPENIFYYAKMLRTNGKYAEARNQYVSYGGRVPAQMAKANKMIAAVDKAILWQKRPPSAVVNLAEGLNSGNADFGPAFLDNGLVFASDRSTGDKNEKIYGWTGRPYLKLYTSTKAGNNTWSKPTLITTAVNAEYHNGPATATSNNKTLFFTRTNLVRVKDPNINNDPTNWVVKPLASDYVNRLEIFSVERQGNEWVNVKPFAYNKVTDYSVGHPALSPDGNLLYFASDMPGGQGETDIYFSEKQADGSWGRPVNAGTVINTSGKEEFPAFGPDGTLYFASDQHPGFGGLDIFSAKGARADWKEVRNMYAPLNSAKDDYGMMMDATGEEGFFSSNRGSQNGTADIYTFRLIKKPAILVVTTLESRRNAKGRTTLTPLPGVRLRLKPQNPADSVIALSNAKGRHNFEVKKGFVYGILGTKEFYLTQSAVVPVDTTSKSDTVRVTLTFTRNKRDNIVALDNIYFDLDKYEIRPDAALELDKVVQLLKDNPRLNIEMGSHCDSREAEGYNQKLSENRARATVNYLISKGINPKRLTAKGYGETRLVNDCYDGVSCSEEEHQRNRRTELKIKS